MSAALDGLKGKVQRMLTEEFGTVQLDNDGDYSLRHQSARVFIKCMDWGDSQTIIRVHAPVLLKVPVTPELCRHVALNNHYVFGSLAIVLDEGDATGLLVFRHNLLGDYLDADELKETVMAIAFTANDLDDELQAEFGGTRFHEDE